MTAVVWPFSNYAREINRPQTGGRYTPQIDKRCRKYGIKKDWKCKKRKKETLQVMLTHETPLQQVHGGGGAAQMRAYNMWIKEKQEGGRGGGESKKWDLGPGLNGNFKCGREACSQSSVQLD